MEQQALWIVAVLGAGTLFGAFLRMKSGFGPMNLRIVGIVLIAVLATLMAIAKADTLNAAMGILGAIAGYLFGAKAENGQETNNSKVSATGATFGDSARVAGRDINETVNNINARVQELGQMLSQEATKIDRLIAIQDEQHVSMEYLINTVYERQLEHAGQAIRAVISHWESEGWKFKVMSSDFHGMDGIFLVFERPSASGEANVYVYHGSKMSKV